MSTYSATNSGVNLTQVSNTTHSGYGVAQLSAAAGAASSSIAASLDTDANVAHPVALETYAFDVAPPAIAANHTPT